MQNLQEYRYPFESAYDFFSEGYWLKLEGLHLALGWVVLGIYLIWMCLCKKSLYAKFTTIYFAAFIFNNYCYSFFSVRFSEFFGVLAALISLIQYRKKHRKPKISYILISIFLFSLIHALAISIIYPEINPTIEQALLRIVLIFKILVLGLVILSFDNEFDTISKVNDLIKNIVVLGFLSCLLYLLQYIIFIFGTLPYGTFFDAGFTGFPTFGSVSIERGHFAKNLAPLFPFFAYQLVNNKKYLIFAFFVLVSIINFSASGQIFFLSYVAIFVFLKRNKFMTLKYYLVFLMILIPALILAGLFFGEQFFGIAEKIRVLVLEGDASGGRGLDTLLLYLDTYPLGTSYGGSTLRTVENLPEINSGISAFIAQYSFFSLMILSWFIRTNVSIFKNSLKVGNKNIMHPFYAGIFVSIIIYCADILWFTPTVWLSLVLCRSFTMLLWRKERI